MGTVISPYETDPPLIVDTDAVLSRPISSQGLQAIARGNPKILQTRRYCQLSELAQRCPLNVDPTRNALATVESGRVGTSEGLDRHTQYYRVALITSNRNSLRISIVAKLTYAAAAKHYAEQVVGVDPSAMFKHPHRGCFEISWQRINITCFDVSVELCQFDGDHVVSFTMLISRPRTKHEIRWALGGIGQCCPHED